MPDTAVNAYQRQRRAQHPRVRQYDLRYAAARNQAIKNLIAAHRTEYLRLLSTEVEKMPRAQAEQPVDLDEIAVQRLMAGDRPARTTVGERREAIRRLHDKGLSAAEIGDRVGLAARNVQRHLRILDGRP